MRQPVSRRDVYSPSLSARVGGRDVELVSASMDRSLPDPLAGGSQYALPSVSWGDTAAREAGSGCPKAVVHSPEFSPIAAHARLNRSRITYPVTEVG